MNEFEKKYYADRRGSGAIKWDGLKFLFGSDDPEMISMWVADMDFHSPECVGEALKKLGESGEYGYYMPSPAYFNAFLNWEEKRHGYKAQREWMRTTPGVVAGIFHFVGAFSQPGDACIILSPCYYPFMEAVEETGRRLVCSMLKNEGGLYTIDFADFERKIEENEVKIFILCSPHNPVGRIWTREELTQLMEICRRHGVLVISDEIHQDLELFGHKHVPTLASCDCADFAVSLTAASKTFNMASFNHSIALVPNKDLRDKYDAYLKHMHLSGAKPGFVAVQAAYEGGESWLDQVIAVVENNVRVVTELMQEGAPKVVISPLEGTYLQWLDIGAYVKAEEIKSFMTERCKLAVDYGSQFFTKEAGEGDTHIRLNLATSEDNVRRAAERLVRELNK